MSPLYVAGGTAISPAGSAGGDLTGTYPNPTIGAGKVVFADLATAAVPTGTSSALATDVTNDDSAGVWKTFHSMSFTPKSTKALITGQSSSAGADVRVLIGATGYPGGHQTSGDWTSFARTVLATGLTGGTPVTIALQFNGTGFYCRPLTQSQLEFAQISALDVLV